MDASLRDVTQALGRWLDEGRPAVLATVVSTDGSAPRGLGARLAIAGPREWIGALSGGCTEAAVIAEAERLLAIGEPDGAALVTYAKETLVDVGPVCGATLGVLVEVVDDVLVGTLERLVDIASAGAAAEYGATYAWQDGRAPGAAEAGTALALVRETVTIDALEDPAAQRLACTRGEDGITLQQQVPAAPHLVLGGAGDIARELVLLAERLAWRTTVVDVRATLLEQLLRACHPSTTSTGPVAEAWEALQIDSRSACVALAHESHLDEPFLQLALAGSAPYVGVVGSRLVQQQRRDALVERGLDAAAIERLRGPAGLDLGGSSAAEIALAIAAEVIATFHDRSGAPLTATAGPIRAR